jgi:hypothetical protein
MVEYYQGFRLFYFIFSFFFLAALGVGFRFGGRWGGGVVGFLGGVFFFFCCFFFGCWWGGGGGGGVFYFHGGFCSFLTLLVCGVQIRLCSIRLVRRGLWFLDSPGVHQISSSFNGDFPMMKPCPP